MLVAGLQLFLVRSREIMEETKAYGAELGGLLNTMADEEINNRFGDAFNIYVYQICENKRIQVRLNLAGKDYQDMLLTPMRAPLFGCCAFDDTNRTIIDIFNIKYEEWKSR